jgi:integrase/recombinase XerD
VKFSRAIDLYIADMRAEGRINSPRSERSYRGALYHHCDDLDNRDPSYVGREDVKRTLRRWPHPNTQRKNRAVLVSFYDWAMEEGYRRDNPARQTRRPKARPPKVYRLTRAEAAALLAAAETVRERRIAHIGICAGARNRELRGLQGRHFQRAGWVWISADIAKGGRQRWVPVLPELEPIAREIRETVAHDEYVIPAQRWRDPGANSCRGDLSRRPSSSQALRTAVMELAARAGIHAHVHPHVMRHAFGDHVARYAGIKNAQALLGHADVGTTQVYTGAPTLDELAAAIQGIRFAVEGERTFYPLETHPASPLEAPTGIEPVYTALQAAA